MGIPGLTQDLNDYAEAAIVGKSPSNENVVCIEKLVIDGPSLVFYIWNRLVGYRKSTVTLARRPISLEEPSYTEINACIIHFLRDLEQCGAQVVKIFFDGALPLSKRPTRQERLERKRQELERYRLIVKSPPGRSPSELDSLDIPAVLWTTLAKTGSALVPPHAPFMVAGALETLLTSKWSARVEVVPGEADEFCAECAASTRASILTNDSDLVLFECGDASSVINLCSLTADISENQSAIRIHALCYRPAEIAKQLGLSSLLTYAYQRSLHLSTGQTWVKNRARTLERSSDAKERAALEVFRRQYMSRTSKAHPPLRTPPTQRSLTGLDPRVAELICSWMNGESIHSYLSILLEDHDRDSSWSYGTNIRQAAYSLLPLIPSAQANPLEFVTEYARRGKKILQNDIRFLSTTDLHRNIQDRLRQSQLHLLPPDTFPRGRESDAITVRYYTLAAYAVVEQKIKRGKEYQDAIATLLGMRGTQMPLEWEHIHLNANLQAILYSWRMLKQMLDYTLFVLQHELSHDVGSKDGDSSSFTSTAIMPVLLDLAVYLRNMPEIATLFLSADEVRRRISKLDQSLVKNNFMAHLSCLEVSHINNDDDAEEETENTADIKSLISLRAKNQSRHH